MFEKPQSAKEQIDVTNNYGFNLEITQRFLGIDNEESLIRCAEESIRGAKKTKLGSGFNAEVFAINDAEGKFSELCVKKIKKNPDVIINDIEDEAKLQAKAALAGVRTPRYVMALRDTVTKEKYIIMERIEGISLAEGNEMPQNFEYKKFFQELRSMLDRMHEARIHHRDLHGGNIMINQEGEPVIIDFGSACIAYGDDLDAIYRADGAKFNQDTRTYVSFQQEKLPRDIGKLEFLEQRLRPLMNIHS